MTNKPLLPHIKIARVADARETLRSLREYEELFHGVEDLMGEKVIDAVCMTLVDYFDMCTARNECHADLAGTGIALAVFRAVESMDNTCNELRGALEHFCKTIRILYAQSNAKKAKNLENDHVDVD